GFDILLSEIYLVWIKRIDKIFKQVFRELIIKRTRGIVFVFYCRDQKFCFLLNCCLGLCIRSARCQQAGDQDKNKHSYKKLHLNKNFVLHCQIKIVTARVSYSNV